MSNNGKKMQGQLTRQMIRGQIENFLAEDHLLYHPAYLSSLPNDLVECFLMVKSDLCLAGAPWFVETFNILGAEHFHPSALEQQEGQMLSQGSPIELGQLPFALAITGERVALNLLQRASSIATVTRQLVEKAEKHGIAILDTRKTTPGLRNLEKYAVRQGGGSNHRSGQTDLWMIKDNHKTFFKGIKEAVAFFQRQKSFYTPLLVEIHSLKEMEEARALGIQHIMLDNFTPPMVKKAIAMKSKGMTLEVSGGVTPHNIEDYLIEGLDAISLGRLTYAPPPVDLAFKFRPLGHV